MRQFETLGDMSKVTSRTIGVAYELSIGTRILPWMILNCSKFEFLENFAGFRRFWRQQQLNE